MDLDVRIPRYRTALENIANGYAYPERIARVALQERAVVNATEADRELDEWILAESQESNRA